MLAYEDGTNITWYAESYITYNCVYKCHLMCFGWNQQGPPLVSNIFLGFHFEHSFIGKVKHNLSQ